MPVMHPPSHVCPMGRHFRRTISLLGLGSGLVRVRVRVTLSMASEQGTGRDHG